MAPVGFGVESAIHFVPSQRSASRLTLWGKSSVPTAMHTVGAGHETAAT